MTQAQLGYVRHYVATLLDGLEQDMEPGTARQFTIDMDAIVAQDPNQPRPDFYYASESQQTRYSCEKCGDFNDIRGRYGYCISCGWRNNAASMRSAFDGLRNKLNDKSVSAEEAVRAAVSEFDSCCRDMATQIRNRIPMKTARKTELERLVFHDIESPTIAAIKSMFDVDLLRNLEGEMTFLKMMMHRRHVFEHNGGVADARYVSLSGDPDARDGVLIRETQANAHRFIGNLARILENFDADFHEIFKPTQWPIDYHQRKRA